MEFNVELKMNTTKELIKIHGLGENGEVQKFVDAECIRLMDSYTPMLSGIMIDSVILGSDIGSGLLEYDNPYARFQYYGNVMIDPNTGSTWAPKYGKKVVTSQKLIHNKSRHPQAGPLWFERMKTDNKDAILKGAQDIVGGGRK